MKEFLKTSIRRNYIEMELEKLETTNKRVGHRLWHFLHKYNAERYFNSWLVLVVDVCIAILSSLSSLVLLEAFTRFRMSLFGRFELSWLGSTLIFSLFMFVLFRTYRNVIRYSTLREISRLLLAVIGKEMLVGVWATLMALMPPHLLWAVIFVDTAVTFLALIAVRVLLVEAYDLLASNMMNKASRMQVLVYGEGNKSVGIVTRLKVSSNYEVCGFLAYDSSTEGHTLSGYPIFSFKNDEQLDVLVKRYGIGGIIFAHRSDARAEVDRLIRYSSEHNIKTLIVPSIEDLSEADEKAKSAIRNIRIEDLLCRPEIKISMDEIVAGMKGKVVLVTGAAGSIGSELCRQLAVMGVQQLIMFDNAETPLHNVRLEFGDNYPGLSFVPIIGDVRQKERLDFVFRTFHPEVVFHAAAYKHVPLMEESPCEAVLVNVVGTRNVADKCLEYDVEKMVMISTDKAVNPTNIMGCTKRLAEIYVQSLGLSIERGEHVGKTKFVTTRFGNVLGSNGSVIPRFREQIAKGGPVTVTHPEINRFFMTIPEACRLVMEAATLSRGNEIFVFDMGEPVKIDSLARRMIVLSGFVPDKDIKIVYTGLRPGEKLYEEVLSSTENTLPTQHERIRIAQVRSEDYAHTVAVVQELEMLGMAVRIPEMVRLMKRAVPEYKSKNSVFEIIDKELEDEKKGGATLE
jgi:FlaA1/EpsC-like NDP-sugar epimerase